MDADAENVCWVCDRTRGTRIKGNHTDHLAIEIARHSLITVISRRREDMVLGSIWPLTEPGAVLTLRCKQTTMLMVLIGPHPESISAFPSCTKSWTLHLIRHCNVFWVHFNSLFSIFMSILGKLGTVSRWVPNHHRAQIYMFWAIYKRGMEIRKTLMGQESNRRAVTRFTDHSAIKYYQISGIIVERIVWEIN